MSRYRRRRGYVNTTPYTMRRSLGTTPRPEFFPTLAAFTSFVDALPHYEENLSNWLWAGGSYSDALRWSRLGWAEGARQASELATKIADRVVSHQSLVTVHEVGYDVAGAAYDAGAYDSGVPECWGVMQPQQAKRAIRIVVNIVASGGISPRTLVTRGIAVAALVIVLQARGHAVTVDVTQGKLDIPGVPNGVVRVADAATGSVADLDRIVFALAQPTMFRKLFRAYANGYVGDDHHDHWGPCMPHSDSRPTDNGEPIDLFIGGVHLYEADRWMDGGEQWIIDEYIRQTQND